MVRTVPLQEPTLLEALALSILDQTVNCGEKSPKIARRRGGTAKESLFLCREWRTQRWCVFRVAGRATALAGALRLILIFPSSCRAGRYNTHKKKVIFFPSNYTPPPYPPRVLNGTAQTLIYGG